MKERVLITGASGFVGYHIVEAAVQAGLEVFAAIRPGSMVAHLSPFAIQYTTLDYANVASLQKELEEKQYTYIIHAAGTTKAKLAQEYERINADFTRNLGVAAAAAAIPLKKFVFISSLAALGPTVYEAPLPIQDQSNAMPVTAYGRSKLVAEKYLAEIEELPLVVLRPTAVYGPREKDIFIVLKTLNLGLEPYISNKPQWLSFVYVKDLAKAVMQALGAAKSHTSYNVSDGNSYDRYALATITKRILGKKSVKVHVPLGVITLVANLLEAAYATSSKMPALNKEKLSELAAENWNCSIERIRQDLGFVPEYDLERGLAQTLQWYKDNKWL
ncbi:NAD-dependent epimerase/dehydratase family protein [Pontibacter qinzhouensis]|uniref:NAD-dependent epimerase/dehydratase family protein n=1 Tax=Pontibacter qinzhouensis TaxID=2603253 RepID=A0A5C8JL55_9BACT|nr:NAD-dependent epimerase/dehydratase family protein [Pontibacter qinzhouensis]TXK37337.1 NAD-dependent epimerase/dehydratase family protein [Pontibacter qinzhouensis]